MSSSYTVIDLVNAAPDDPPMLRVVVCEDCGWELHLAEGAAVPYRPGIGAYSFDAAPHRFLFWVCDCGAELGVWTDRDGVPVTACQ